MANTKVFLFYNNKGGIGKSTVSINVAEILGSCYGKKVLIVEWDGQNTISSMANIDVTRKGKAEYGDYEGEVETSGSLALRFEQFGECATYEELKEAIVTPNYYIKQKDGMKWEDGVKDFAFDIIPSVGQDLSAVELTFMSQQNSPNKPYILEDEGKMFNRLILSKAIIEPLKEMFDYDYILIDCPPSLGIMALNGLAATSNLVIPTTMDKVATDGITTVLRNLETVKKYIPDFYLNGILFNRYRKTRKTDRDVEEMVEESLVDTDIKVFVSRIPDVQLVTDSNLEYTLPVHKKGPFREAIINLVEEIIEGEN